MVTSTSRERGAERRAQLFNIHSVISLGWESKPFARCWCQFGRVHASLAGILRARPGHGWDRANFSGPLVDWTSGDHRCGQEGGISKQLSDKHRLCPEATWRHLHGTGGAAWELVGRLDAEVCFHRLKRFLVFKVSSGGFKKSELSAPILTRSERDRMTDALRPLACVESSPEYHRGGRSG